jgi:hypothetical protein
MGTIVGLGLLCGLIGQGLRILVGLYKSWCTTGASSSYWSSRRVIITLVAGAVIGVLATYSINWGEEVEAGEVVGYVAIAYAGVDLLEGLMTRYFPKSTAPGRTQAA